MKKQILVAVILICAVISVNAQLPELSTTLKNIAPKTQVEKARIAYENGDFQTAEALLYTELEKGNFKPEDFLLFANSLRMDGKPALAKEFYKEYAAAASSENVNRQIDKLASNPKPVASTKINTKYPVSNPSLNYGRLNTAITGKMMAYNYACDGSLSGRVEVLDNITDMPFGKVTYFDNGNKAVVSLLDNLKSTTKLYYLYQKKGKWKKPIELFTDAKGNYAFPYMNVDNNTLYFSSDRSGGQGGYDIYASIWNSDGFEKPINLGGEINSAGNEVNPIMANDWLYFASNGHVALGGYDVYKHKKLSENNTLFLNASEFNTTGNEYGVLPLGKSAFYLTRQGKEGNELLYVEKEAVTTTLSGNVIDEAGKPISGAYVLITTGGLNDFVLTDAGGNFKYTTAANYQALQGVAMAEGYITESFDTKSTEKPGIKLIKQKPVEVIKEVVKTTTSTSSLMDSNTSSEVISNSVTTAPIEQEVTEVLISESVDETQSVSSRPDRGLYYIVIGSTYDYAQAYDFWNKWIPEFNGAEILEYGNGLYRIGVYAGTSEEQAVKTYNEAKAKKKDIWILRPKN